MSCKKYFTHYPFFSESLFLNWFQVCCSIYLLSFSLKVFISMTLCTTCKGNHLRSQGKSDFLICIQFTHHQIFFCSNQKDEAGIWFILPQCIFQPLSEIQKRNDRNSQREQGVQEKVTDNRVTRKVRGRTFVRASKAFFSRQSGSYSTSFEYTSSTKEKSYPWQSTNSTIILAPREDISQCKGEGKVQCKIRNK